MANYNIIRRIQSLLNDLPKAEKKIAEEIVSNPIKVVNMTAAEVGDKTGTSGATVIRLCKRLGVGSFTQLKLQLAADVDHSIPIGYSDVDENESIEEIKRKLMGNAFQSMQDTLSILEVQKINEAVKYIEQAGLIYVFGVGASQLVAQNIAQKWSRIGKTTISLSDPHSLVPALTGAPKDTLFIGISNSGFSQEVIKMMQLANRLDLQTISLTQLGSNPLSTIASLSLHTVKARESELRSAATSSLHAQFIAVDVLFYAYASTNYKKVITVIRESKNEVDNYKKK